MNTSNNPFVLPGFGQSGDIAGNPLMASMEMMQQAWAGLAGPGGLAQAMPVPMSLEDLDRRIAELRTVENWLKLNQSMLASTIQGMEVQRATIATLKSFVGTPPSGDAPSPLEIVLGLKPAPASASAASEAARPAQAEPAPSPAGDAAGQGAADAANAGAAAAAMAQSATQAWWNLMQQQFGQLATAAASSMSEAAASAAPAAKPSASAAKAKPAAARKAPVKRAAAPSKRSAPAKSARKPG